MSKTKDHPSKGSKSPEAQYALLKMLSMYYGWELKLDADSKVVVHTGIKKPGKKLQMQGPADGIPDNANGVR